MKDKISVGGFLGYSSYKQSGGFNYYSIDSTFESKASYILIGALGNYHFYDQDKLNFYGGATLGYAIANSKDSAGNSTLSANLKASTSGAIFSLQVGGSYFFSDNFATNAELSYGISILKIGGFL